MKSVLMSIRPHWALLIAEGKKTVEVRKTKPKLETPFKVYIYCTKDFTRGTLYEKPLDLENAEVLQGKVIGEFVCDWVESTPLWRIKGNTGFCAKRTEREELLPKMACLSIEEIEKYVGSENRLIYGWHISNLVIYDKPKELGEFHREEYCYPCINPSIIPITRPPQSWCYVESEVQGE